MIRNLIFDVGNVLLEYRWVEALMDTGLTEEKAIETGRKIFESKQWVMFDAGNISVEEIIEEYGRMFPEEKENIAEFILHPERMPLPRQEVWDKIRILKGKGYKIYLLSNYSEHLFTVHTKGRQFMEDIDGRIVSYEVHQVKPDRDIYESLIDKYGLLVDECIFFDDRPENTATAETLGIKSFTIESRDHMNDVLQNLIDKAE